MAFVVPGLLSAIGLLLVFASGWLWLRDGARRLCPGPRISWLATLMPVRLIFQPRCAYDLSGHSPDARGVIVCPECGRHVHRRKQMIRSARSFRPGRIGCALIAGGMLVYRYPPLAATTVVQYTPTNMLLRGEGVLGVGTPLEVREEIRRRAMDHQFDSNQVLEFIRLLVSDLKDDSLTGNAREALEKLAIFGVFDPTPLKEALQSSDGQQRRLAAQLLRTMPDAGVPSEAILRATIEDLQSDDRGRNARAAQYFLKHYLDLATPLLIEQMNSSDRQQRQRIMELLRSAEIGGDALDAVIRAAVEDLRDDEVNGNADRARWYLGAHVDDARPLLIEAMHGDDQQQSRAAMDLLRYSATSGELLDELLRLSLGDLRSASSRSRAQGGFAHLLRNAWTAEPLLAEGMLGDDARQRLLCAAVAGCAGRRDLMTQATPILVLHLADNKIVGDGIVAARALAGFGIDVVPLLEAHRQSPDNQQRQAVEYIVQRLTTDKSPAQLQRELPLARLTQSRLDALAIEPNSLRLPVF